MKYTIWADGSCLGNPGWGGTAYVLVREDPQTRTLINSSGSAHLDTTNNRMELLAVIEAFRHLQTIESSASVDLILDSKYVGQGLTVWMKNWKQNNWRTADKKPVKNQDLWLELDSLSYQYDIQFQWIKGHDGDAMNDYVDTEARKRATEIKGK